MRALGPLGIGVRGVLEVAGGDAAARAETDQWGAGLALGRRVQGAELKLVAVAAAADQSALPPELAEARGLAAGTLAVTGPKKAPQLWLRCADGWVQVHEAQIAGRGRMSIPELVRALGKRSASGPGALLSTSPAGP